MLLERDVIGNSPSSCSAAVLGQFYGSTQASGMARDSLRYYAGLEGKTGRSLGFLRSGVLTLAKGSSEKARQRLRELVEMQDSIGIRVECADSEQIRELCPGIQISDEEIAAWEPTAGCLDPQLAVESLTALARNRGAVIREGNPVEKILVEGGRVVGIESDDGRIDCDQVVVAAGPWTRSILEELGVSLPIECVLAEHYYIGSQEEHQEEVRKQGVLSIASPEASGATGWYSRESLNLEGGETALEERHSEEAAPIKTAHPVLTDPKTGFYVRCDPLQSRVSVGRRGGDFIPISSPDDYDPNVGPAFSAWARAVLESRLPHYAEQPDLGAETGLFTRTPDNQPLLGKVEGVEGLYIACGFSGHSFTMAPSVGEGIAQMLMGEPVSAFDEEFYSPQRYL